MPSAACEPGDEPERYLGSLFGISCVVKQPITRIPGREGRNVRVWAQRNRVWSLGTKSLVGGIGLTGGAYRRRGIATRELRTLAVASIGRPLSSRSSVKVHSRDFFCMEEAFASSMILMATKLATGAKKIVIP